MNGERQVKYFSGSGPDVEKAINAWLKVNPSFTNVKIGPPGEITIMNYKPGDYCDWNSGKGVGVFVSYKIG
ncbi:MAG: hypothetical protein CEO22_144 [Candidatus Berkelbacteria bacterium Gr01-1014_85]|uniref:Uncharacterized protein n=1 Tax=Candidatus Berkelbacteria bacterium Gr01-1014_85 TaxID=2017150 RepID=A0A554JD62_9BACT|nr:MAG: hypothetical protein CEO22_144 [Candidatus Berkelbacteria bacterium Gr01-1014_85]